jgi:hypothetical protein
LLDRRGLVGSGDPFQTSGLLALGDAGHAALGGAYEIDVPLGVACHAGGDGDGRLIGHLGPGLDRGDGRLALTRVHDRVERAALVLGVDGLDIHGLLVGQLGLFQQLLGVDLLLCVLDTQPGRERRQAELRPRRRALGWERAAVAGGHGFQRLGDGLQPVRTGHDAPEIQPLRVHGVGVRLRGHSELLENQVPASDWAGGGRGALLFLGPDGRGVGHPLANGVLGFGTLHTTLGQVRGQGRWGLETFTLGVQHDTLLHHPGQLELHRVDRVLLVAHQLHPRGQRAGAVLLLVVHVPVLRVVERLDHLVQRRILATSGTLQEPGQRQGNPRPRRAAGRLRPEAVLVNRRGLHGLDDLLVLLTFQLGLAHLLAELCLLGVAGVELGVERVTPGGVSHLVMQPGRLGLLVVGVTDAALERGRVVHGLGVRDVLTGRAGEVPEAAGRPGGHDFGVGVDASGAVADVHGRALEAGVVGGREGRVGRGVDAGQK